MRHQILDTGFDATVRLIAAGEGEPHATGFFYTDYAPSGVSPERAAHEWDERIWLITNRHVLWTSAKGPRHGLDICLRDPDYTGGFKPPEPEQRIHLDAHYLAANAWLPNPHLYEEPDIAGIEIVDEIRKQVEPWVFHHTVTEWQSAAGTTHTSERTRLRILTRADCDDPWNVEADAGDRVLAIGYPVGGVDEVTGIPIAKGGVIATTTGWEGTQSFLVDINQFPGASGSPIFTAPEKVIVYTPDTGKNKMIVTRPQLIGIHCGGRTDGDQHVGLGVAWGLPWSLFAIIDPEQQPVTLAEYNAGVT